MARRRMPKDELRELAKKTNPYDLSDLARAERLIHPRPRPDPRTVNPYDLSDLYWLEE